MSRTVASKFPHVEWVDLHDNGVMIECGIMSRDRIGNIFFIELSKLDDVDKRRFHSVITNKNSPHYTLWELMGQITLGNGSNALEYFHQLVKVLTPQGQIINPRAGVVGAPGEIHTPRRATQNTSKTEIKSPKTTGGATIGQ